MQEPHKDVKIDDVVTDVSASIACNFFDGVLVYRFFP